MTPVHNGADFIDRSYAVLREQTFTDWQWVVVDDGSTDETAKIVRAIGDERVILVSYPKNRGRGYARTKALEACSGDWVVLWDVDDIYFPDRLERIELARREGYDYFCSYTVVVDNDLNIKGVRGFLPASQILPRYFVHHTLACPVELARKIGYDILETPGGPGEDCRIVITLAAQYRGCYVDEALAVYQEDREVNLTKAIHTNVAQSLALRDLYHEGILQGSRWRFAVMMFRRKVKLMILYVMTVAPSLYRWTVKLRTNGQIDPEFKLDAQRREFIQRVQQGEWPSSQSHSDSQSLPSPHGEFHSSAQDRSGVEP